jgi:archaellum component FlaC
MEDRIKSIENLLGDMISYMKSVQEAISSGFTQVQENLDSLNDRVTKIEIAVNKLHGDTSSNFDTVDGKLSGFDGKLHGMGANFQSIDGKLDALREEIKKISDVTGYEELHNNLRRIK